MPLNIGGEIIMRRNNAGACPAWCRLAFMVAPRILAIIAGLAVMTFIETIKIIVLIALIAFMEILAFVALQFY